ncbi:DNA-binding protein [Methylobacterium sp. D54C]
MQEIELVAAKLLRTNRRVSVCNVRGELPRGGSHSDIGPILAVWKANANYRPKELPKEIPGKLAPVIEEFAAKLWAAAREEAETVVEARLRQQAELERVYEVEAGIAWAEAGRLTEEVRRLRGLLCETGQEIGTMLPP